MRKLIDFVPVAFVFSLAGCSAEEIQSNQSELSDAKKGEKLYKNETFDGNGRTCETCHSLQTGTLSMAQIQAQFAEYQASQGCGDDDEDEDGDGHDGHEGHHGHHHYNKFELFRSIDSDDGIGDDYNRLVSTGTFRVEIPLPPNVRLANDPTATSVTVFRSQGTTINIGLDPVLMWDGREPDLESQALGAINAHYEAEDAPTDLELMRIATFESEKLYSSEALKAFANGGPAPTLPPGNTESEIRGRAFFVFNPANPFTSPCAVCHSGPMLNTSVGGPVPPNARILKDGVSEFNLPGFPVRSYILTKPDGSTLTFASPDPGRVLITGNPADINRFKIPTLWNVKNTAPYFHDNSALTLEAVAAHYDQFLRIIAPGFPGLTPQQQADIVAYLKLL